MSKLTQHSAMIVMKQHEQLVCPVLHPLTEAFIAAGVVLGWPRNHDYNGASQEGFGAFQLTVRQGQRHSTADGYFHPAQNRSNLTVWTDTLVTRVLLDGTRVVGVASLRDGVEQHVQAKQEVILSAGAINSPQVLMLSGIGPADQLRALDIPMVADLPGVGQNLQDHPNVYVHFKTKPSFTQFGHAPEGLAFVKTEPDLPEPDIQIWHVPYFFPPPTSFSPPAPINGYTMVLSLVRSQSQGHLRLRSTDPTQPPAIYANYFAYPADLQTLFKGVQLARSLSKTRAYAPFYEAEGEPGSRIQNDQDLLDYTRTTAETTFHPTGPCKMGHDVMAVVDEQLRVHGIEGLRVVDASIMPIIPNGNTNGPVIMIAEKAAGLMSSHRS
jgi:choline dehydrogenase